MTSMVNGSMTFITNDSVRRMFNIPVFTRMWYFNIITAFHPIMNFINGSGGVLFHILLSGSYRKTFRKTTFGRFFCKNDRHEKSTLHRQTMTNNQVRVIGEEDDDDVQPSTVQIAVRRAIQRRSLANDEQIGDMFQAVHHRASTSNKLNSITIEDLEVEQNRIPGECNIDEPGGSGMYRKFTV